MRPNFKLFLSLFGILALAATAFWIDTKSIVDLTYVKLNYTKSFPIKLGLDLQGGSHLIYQADFKDVADEDKPESLRGVKDTIERRVNSFGVAEPNVVTQGEDKVVVELPGIKDVNEAIKQIGETPFLEFRTQSSETPEAQVDANGQVTVDPLSGWSPTGLTGKQLKRANVDIPQGSAGQVLQGRIAVRLEFNDEGKDLFARLTSENLGKPLAIILDGAILSAPTVNSAITDGVAIITGNFTLQQAKDLALRLNSGALPVPIKLVSQQTIGATLGQESIHKSLIAGIIGLIMIALFMLLYYRLPGLLAVFALAIYVLLSVLVFKIGISFTAVVLVGLFFVLGITASAWFGILALVSYVGLMLAGAVSPVTLTLAGIAGFILSIGMAVDANILIFERMKEELRAGKDFGKALEDGFSRAWNSIRDSNVSSLISVVILYTFGTPSIKGFAVALGVGIIISMFTAISITRTFMLIVSKVPKLKHNWLYGIRSEKSS